MTAHIRTVGHRACFLFCGEFFCTSKADLLANNVGNIFEYKNPLGLLPGGFYPTNHTMKIGAFTHIMSSQCKNVGIKRFSLPFCNDSRDFNLGPVGLIWVDMISLQFLSLWKMRSSS